MRQSVLFMVLILAVLPRLKADDGVVKVVTEAAEKLAGSKSYTWVSTSKSAEGTSTWRQGPTEGRTQQGGLAYITFTLGDTQIELAFAGSKSAIKWADQWHGASELEGDTAWIGKRLMSFMFAAQEASFLAKQSQELKDVGDGVMEGGLGPKAIMELLSRGRREVKDASGLTGRVKFWIEQGRLQRYEFNVKGQLPKGGDDERELNLDRTTTVEISKVGETKVEVPEEGRNKLR